MGNHPVLYAQKRVALLVDLGSPGIVDPGDVLRYTITVQNSGATPATGVVLKDPVPANTTYVANSTLLTDCRSVGLITAPSRWLRASTSAHPA